MRSKRIIPKDMLSAQLDRAMQVPMQEAPRKYKIHRTSLSLSLSPETAELREELSKVTVLSLVGRFVNDSSVIDIIPSIINRPLAGPVTPLNDFSLLLPLKSRKEVKEICKQGTFKVMMKDGPCTLKLAPWSAELGADWRASGEGWWVLIWNLPSHGWCWRIIAEILKSVGDRGVFPKFRPELG